ncbi:unnamed protein product [Tetraodon nigroviridis]|uniref:(spotted green pufferfish) hypothetical protein n=1 Tax=Tetraodon nigroviridis TaxID=99883 RepID=Q4SBN5_TETNG|nr:unnamed protein product [Tetraodon nigroviridis]
MVTSQPPQAARMASEFIPHLLVGEWDSIVLAVFMTPNCDGARSSA